jgi:N6-adenosine-specific RNA methylase IME4
MPVASLAAHDAALFLWVPARLNREGVGVAVARAWDFEPTSEFVWSKGLRLGGGFPRICHEVILVCKRGEHAFKRSPWVNSVQAWRRIEQDAHRHSTKPDGFLDLVEQYSEGPYLELFARRHRLGWDVWGDQSANTAQIEPHAVSL